MKRMLIIVVLLFGLVTPAVAREPVRAITTADAIAIHAAVQAQLDAFANDDAPAAFALATLEKRMLIGSPDIFMRLIRELYQPIYRSRTRIFAPPEVIDGMAVQLVRVSDSQHRVWVAIFVMQEESGNGWKIDDCQLLETTTVSV